jgi:putative transposase
MTPPIPGWPLDLVEDKLVSGRKLRILNVLDIFSRYALGSMVEHSLTGEVAARHLEWLFLRYGAPQVLRRDQGPEFESKVFKKLLLAWRVQDEAVPKAQPYDNGHLESFNGSLREGLLDAELFHSLEDATGEGGRLRLLTVLDEFTRENLAIVVARSLPAKAVITVLARLFAERGAPVYLRSDNGPEFVARAIKEWLGQRGVKTHYIDPGSPWQNAYGESFNDKFRDECLNQEVFRSVTEAQVICRRWSRYYNEERPHSSLGYLTPREFRTVCQETQGGRCPRTPGV